MAEICINLAEKRISSLVEGEILTGPDAKSFNSFEKPEVVTSKPFDGVTVTNGKRDGPFGWTNSRSFWSSRITGFRSVRSIMKWNG